MLNCNKQDHFYNHYCALLFFQFLNYSNVINPNPYSSDSHFMAYVALLCGIRNISFFCLLCTWFKLQIKLVWVHRLDTNAAHKHTYTHRPLLMLITQHWFAFPLSVPRAIFLARVLLVSSCWCCTLHA